MELAKILLIYVAAHFCILHIKVYLYYILLWYQVPAGWITGCFLLSCCGSC